MPRRAKILIIVKTSTYNYFALEGGNHVGYPTVVGANLADKHRPLVLRRYDLALRVITAPACYWYLPLGNKLAGQSNGFLIRSKCAGLLQIDGSD